eukprot:TRINITY_DN4216_c0_g1_i2.p1 TRINITY_DN4216_c0_g1~~TRINITY_DN4216_c0_g1_i2.p1  ORF type:complete len:340 (-),score=37.48 TRINITY_DN4216_c0_g1_i2:12-980(-)
MWLSTIESYKNVHHNFIESDLLSLLDHSPQKLSTLPIVSLVSSENCCEVYRVILDRTCVILKKTLLHELYDLHLFKSQVALYHRLAKLGHIVPVAEYGVYREADLKEYSYVVYEFHGDPLSAEIAGTVSQYPVEDCRVFVTSLCKTLEQMQRMQLVHLGLSPYNVIFKDNETVFLVSLESVVSVTSFLTGTAMCKYLPLLLGKPAYLAPELLVYIGGRESKLKASFNPYCASVYSIGLIVVQMLTQASETKLLGKHPKEINKLFSKVCENESDGANKLFLELVSKVLLDPLNENRIDYILSLIHICRCRRIERCRSRWSPYH